MKIPLRNPGISAMPTQKYQKKEKTSQYKGVHRIKRDGQWRVRLMVNGQIQNGGCFTKELAAAKKVNELCEKLKIPLRNPGIEKGANPTLTSEISKSDDDDDHGASKKKRKRKKKFIASEHYFYEQFLQKRK
jgi:hypothetical protein